jgi:hypothetical protein
VCSVKATSDLVLYGTFPKEYLLDRVKGISEGWWLLPTVREAVAVTVVTATVRSGVIVVSAFIRPFYRVVVVDVRSGVVLISAPFLAYVSVIVPWVRRWVRDWIVFCPINGAVMVFIKRGELRRRVIVPCIIGRFGP